MLCWKVVISTSTDKSCIAIVLPSETDAIYGNKCKCPKQPVAKMGKAGKLLNLANFSSFFNTRTPINTFKIGVILE